MSIDQIRSALDTLDATPRDGFLEQLEDRLVAAWDDDAGLDVDDPPVWAGDVAPHPQPSRQRWMLAAAAAIGVLALGLVASVASRDPDTVRTDPGPSTPSTDPVDSSPDAIPATTTGGSDPGAAPATSGGMWPQSSVDEVTEAQALADAGDPDHSWQVDPRLLGSEWWEYLRQPGAEIADRFLREELGWEEYLFNPFAGDDGDGAADGIIRIGYLRCAAGATNPLYPNAMPGDARGADGCAPTIDELRYEAVIVDLSQPVRQGADGIWVVNRWSMTAPFSQADPLVVEATATAQLEAFLQARIDGELAAGVVEVSGLSELSEVPLLYATSAGAPYDRFEIELVGGPRWPYGDMDFTVRLFSDGGETEVEQRFSWSGGSLSLAERSTTENGQPLAAPYSFFDGEVTASAPAPWKHAFEQHAALVLGEDNFSERNIELMADPFPVATGCERGTAPADAEALAASLRADPDLVTTAPAPVRIAGRAGFVLDVTVAPEAGVCDRVENTLVLTPGPDAGDDPRREGGLARGSRMRLYLLDHPEGSPATQILAIAIVAPESRFDDVLEAAAPVIESIEFQTR